MQHSEFEVGKTFYTTNGWKWQCTDKGTRTITAIHVEEERDPSWYEGPPYAVPEVVFDECYQQACSKVP